MLCLISFRAQSDLVVLLLHDAYLFNQDTCFEELLKFKFVLDFRDAVFQNLNSLCLKLNFFIFENIILIYF